MQGSDNTFAGLIKDGAYCLSALPIFEGLHSFSLLTSIMPLLESKAVAALITGMFICCARLLETRLSNQWRQRAITAEEELAKLHQRGQTALEAVEAIGGITPGEVLVLGATARRHPQAINRALRRE